MKRPGPGGALGQGLASPLLTPLRQGGVILLIPPVYEPALLRGPRRAFCVMPGNHSHGFHPEGAYDRIKATRDLKTDASQNSVSAIWTFSAAWQEVPGKRGLSTGLGLPASSASLQPSEEGPARSSPLCLGRTDRVSGLSGG